MVGSRTLRVSSPDKVLFPSGVTKGELVDYYEAMAPWILAHARGRALTLRRYPDGIDGEGWFQKNVPQGAPEWLTLTTVSRRRQGGSTTHIVLDEAATLVYVANLAAIELHMATALADGPDHPLEVIFDLDPPKGAPAGVVRSAARRCRDLLVELGIEPRLKSSGSSGFHVHVLLDGQVPREEARDFAQAIAVVLAGRHPRELTAEHRVDKRAGRVFVDWLRNSPAQTVVVPYSVRARDGAPVATPMDWDELRGSSPRRWDIRSVRRRLAQRDDAWAAPGRPADLDEARSVLVEVLRELRDTGAMPRARRRTGEVGAA